MIGDMGCGCGAKGSGPGLVNGKVALATFPDCDDTYSGENPRQAIYIVGRGDPSLERLFLRKNIREAGAYSRSVRKSLVAYPANAICSQAVEALLEG